MALTFCCIQNMREGLTFSDASTRKSESRNVLGHKEAEDFGCWFIFSEIRLSCFTFKESLKFNFIQLNLDGNLLSTSGSYFLSFCSVVLGSFKRRFGAKSYNGLQPDNEVRECDYKPLKVEQAAKSPTTRFFCNRG